MVWTDGTSIVNIDVSTRKVSSDTPLSFLQTYGGEHAAGLVDTYASFLSDDRERIETWKCERQRFLLILESTEGTVLCVALIHRIPCDPWGNHDNPYVLDYITTPEYMRRRGCATRLLRLLGLTYMCQQTVICSNDDEAVLFRRAGYRSDYGNPAVLQSK